MFGVLPALASRKCFNILTIGGDWPRHLYWTLGNCSSSERYLPFNISVEECCLQMGDYTIKCYDLFDSFNNYDSESDNDDYDVPDVVLDYDVPDVPLDYDVPDVPLDYDVPDVRLDYDLPDRRLDYDLPDVPIDYIDYDGDIDYPVMGINTTVWIEGVAYCRDFQNRYSYFQNMTVTEPGGENCFNITFLSDSYDDIQMSWLLGHCGAKDYLNGVVHTEECCLEMGDYKLTCLSADKYGWSLRARIWINGVRYCNGFFEGFIYQEDFIVTLNPTTIPSPALTPVTTPYPSDSPTLNPTPFPTPAPTNAPTFYPTDTPTPKQTRIPTTAPTHLPTLNPSVPPTPYPSDSPTLNPTPFPIPAPTNAQIIYTTEIPTRIPTRAPTHLPTLNPSVAPSCSPISPYPTRAPNADCVKTEQNWSEEIAKQHCSADNMGSTNKGADAVVCPDYNQYYQRRLNYSLANQAFLSCSAWCVYDAYTEGYGEVSERYDAFIWRNPNGCWEPIRKGLCIYGNTDDRDKMADYIENTLCESCIPLYPWNDDRAEEVCQDNGSANKTFGVRVCDDPNSSTKQDRLEKSLANRFFAHCPAYCVYDFDTIMSNGGNYGGFMWKQTCWKWVTGWDCFEKHMSEFRIVSSRAAKLCEF